MRIKFKKGMTPEDIANMFVKLVNDRNLLIGSVNIYIQEFDQDMQPIKYDEQYIEIKPTEYGMNRYKEYEADLRRSNLKVV